MRIFKKKATLEELQLLQRRVDGVAETLDTIRLAFGAIGERLNGLDEDASDLQEQISVLGFALQGHKHDISDPIEPSDPYAEPPAWAVEKYTTPKLTTMEHGIVWAQFIHSERKVLRIANNVGGEHPLMEPPSPSSGKRVWVEPGDMLLVYRKTFQGDGDMFVEVCDPYGQGIEWKWIKFIGVSSTGK